MYLVSPHFINKPAISEIDENKLALSTWDAGLLYLQA